ncbi:UDP-N-acetylhexosamine pyrophosphorylase-like protein 1 [Frankliniella fusca]|uniref:UDP-N-acetylhexosamine pyrophosphorylase-like protein 1 n=1 Tax=Frankliniella fusca TaxID=407009 RepID=A0AAE1LTD2_9NEOP|nr:UDP-N-acetylhexosamine pyrophosphorylase-like protein 1 [Frankliniella fusca]
MCYRNFPHSEVNTTGHIESFHNRLKRVYLKRKVNKRLDDLVTHLFDIEWDDHCTRTREATIGFSSQPQHIAERHQRGLLTNSCNVRAEGDLVRFQVVVM